MTDNERITRDDIAGMIADTLAELEGIMDTDTSSGGPATVLVQLDDGRMFTVEVS